VVTLPGKHGVAPAASPVSAQPSVTG